MQILNSKAYYLKNYSFQRRTKSNTKPKHSQTQPARERQIKSISETFKITNINYLPRINSDIHPNLSIRTESNISKPEEITTNKDRSTIYEKQKSILLKLLNKQRQSRKKRSKSLSNNCVVLESHPLGDVKPYQFQIMKPTDRYFHQMENVRLAEKLLLVQPTESIKRKSLQKFYKQQSKLKTNITKLSYRQNKKQRASKTKLLSRRKWMD